MIAGCLMGMDMLVADPRELWPEAEDQRIARELETRYGAKLEPGVVVACDRNTQTNTRACARDPAY
jgi:ornithine carbamoyltransferase